MGQGVIKERRKVYGLQIAVILACESLIAVIAFWLIYELMRAGKLK